MFKLRQRTVHFHELSLECVLKSLKVKAITPMSITRALDLARAECQAEKYAKASGKRPIILNDWQLVGKKNCQALVFSCSDPDLSDTALRDLQNWNLRFAGKKKTEAVEKSCHVLIQPSEADETKALMLLITGSGVSANKVKDALNSLIVRASKNPLYSGDFTRSNPSSAEGSKLEMTAKLVVTGHQSQFLKDIIRTGVLSGVELITNETRGIDGDDGYQISKESVHVDVVGADERHSLSKLKRMLSSFEFSSGRKVDKARVHYKETSDGETKSKLFKVNEIEQAFTHSVVIEFDSDLPPVNSVVDKTIVDKLLELV